MNKCPITGETCNKHRSYKITEIDKGKATQELQLCEKCVAAYVSGPAVEKSLAQLQTVDDFIGFLTKGSQELKNAIVATKTPGPCPKCNGSFEDMIKTEKIGCAYCYEHFGEALKMVIHKTQGSLKHVGKVPKNWKKQEKPQKPKKPRNPKKPREKDVDHFIVEQNAEMLKVIEAENYEEAARIRDNLASIAGLREKLKDFISDEDFEQGLSEMKFKSSLTTLT